LLPDGAVKKELTQAQKEGRQRRRKNKRETDKAAKAALKELGVLPDNTTQSSSDLTKQIVAKLRRQAAEASAAKTGDPKWPTIPISSPGRPRASPEVIHAGGRQVQLRSGELFRPTDPATPRSIIHLETSKPTPSPNRKSIERSPGPTWLTRKVTLHDTLPLKAIEAPPSPGPSAHPESQLVEIPRGIRPLPKNKEEERPAWKPPIQFADAPSRQQQLHRAEVKRPEKSWTAERIHIVGLRHPPNPPKRRDPLDPVPLIEGFPENRKRPSVPTLLEIDLEQKRKKKKEELDEHERKRLLEVKAIQKEEERALEKRKQVEEKKKEKDRKRKEESEKRNKEAQRSRRSSGYIRRDLVEDLRGKIPQLKEKQSFHLARLTDKFEKEQERKKKSRVQSSSPKRTVRERLGPRISPEPTQEDILGAHVDINLLG